MAVDRLSENIELVKNGKKIWEKWISELNLSNRDCVLIFPENDISSNMVFLKYVSEFMENRKYQHAALIFSESHSDYEKILESIDHSLVFDAPKAEVKAVMKLYSLYPFSDRLVVCALEIPEGRMGMRTLECGLDCTLDDIARAGIYRI